MHKQLANRDWLTEEYVEKRRTLTSIAQEVGCNKTSVQRALQRLGIARRPHTSRFYLLNDKEWLQREYVEKKRTMRDIADEVGSTPGNVASALYVLGIRTRSPKEMAQYPRMGDKSSNWKGGRRIRQGGYMFIRMPEHPAAQNGYVQEHRLVMEKVLGRYLEPYEVVHHKDGNRTNNAEENLEVVVRGTHVSNHFKASHEVVRLRQENVELRARLKRYEDRYGPLE